MTQDPSRTAARHEVPEGMRRDVGLLGGLLGEVLQEYGTESSSPASLYDDVERLRGLCIGAVEDDTEEKLAEAESFVESLDPERAKEVARAFTCYFLLANLAEEQQRIRTLRTRDGETSLEEQSAADSVAAAFRHLSDEVGQREAERRLKELRFHPVLTAHPTEARRNAVTASIRRIGQLLDIRDDPRTGPAAAARNTRELFEEVDNLWRTAQLRVSNPSPLDEVRTALRVFDNSFSSVFTEAYRRMDDWLQEERAGAAAPKAPRSSGSAHGSPETVTATRTSPRPSLARRWPRWLTACSRT